MKLTKILFAILALCLALTLFAACDSNESKTNDDKSKTEESTKKDDSESVREAYNSLNKAFTLTSAVMDDIYKSWYFTVYTTNKFDSSGWGGFELQGINTAYADAIGREYGVVSQACVDAFNLDWTNRSKFKAVIKDVSYSVALIKQILENEGTYSYIEVEMEKAKDALKDVNKDNDCYEDLMAYYTEMLSFQEFAESPSGSFSGLENTVSSYEKNIQGYKNKLSIYIDQILTVVLLKQAALNK